MTTNPQPKDDKNMIFRNGEWIRKTAKPAMSDRPLPAPENVDDMAWLDEVFSDLISTIVSLGATDNPRHRQRVELGQEAEDQAKAAIATHIQREKELAVVEARMAELKWANTRSPAGKLSDIDYEPRMVELEAQLTKASKEEKV